MNFRSRVFRERFPGFGFYFDGRNCRIFFRFDVFRFADDKRLRDFDEAITAFSDFGKIVFRFGIFSLRLSGFMRSLMTRRRVIFGLDRRVMRARAGRERRCRERQNHAETQNKFLQPPKFHKRRIVFDSIYQYSFARSISQRRQTFKDSKLRFP